MTKIPITQNKVLNAYIKLQVSYLSHAYWQPCLMQVNFGKYRGEYYSRLSFHSPSIQFKVICKSWSPYKAMEAVTNQARDQILERTYSICKYV